MLLDFVASCLYYIGVWLHLISKEVPIVNTPSDRDVEYRNIIHVLEDIWGAIVAPTKHSPIADFEATLNKILSNQEKQMAAIDDLQAAVAAETAVDASVEALLTSLAAQLTAALATNDTTAIEAVVSTMQANAAALSAAVAANTPAAPVTPTP